MSAFDEDYRRLVTPRLAKAVAAHAGLAADGVETFGEAVGAVMHLACGYGAGYLSDDRFSALEHWVMDRIAEALERELDR